MIRIHHFSKVLLITFLSVSLFWACTKETVHTLVYPTTFTFKSPILEDRAVYSIDTISSADPTKKDWIITKIIENFGSFDKSNADISDTLNFIIRNTFSSGMVSKITLLDGNQMEIEYSILRQHESNSQLDTVVFDRKEVVNYTQVGNSLSASGLSLYLNNESREINICNEFILANWKTMPDTSSFKYYINECTSVDPETALTNFLKNRNSIKYDTASVEIVNYIFTDY